MIQFFICIVVLDHMMADFLKKMVLIMFTMLLMGLKEKNKFQRGKFLGGNLKIFHGLIHNYKT